MAMEALGAPNVSSACCVSASTLACCDAGRVSWPASVKVSTASAVAAIRDRSILSSWLQTLPGGLQLRRGVGDAVVANFQQPGQIGAAGGEQGSELIPGDGAVAGPEVVVG